MASDPTKDMTWDDIDTGLKRIAEMERAIAEKKVELELGQARLKQRYEDYKKARNEDKKGVLNLIKKAFNRLKKGPDMNGLKSRQLRYGRIGYRAAPRSLSLRKGVTPEQAIENVKALGLAHELIRTTEEINIEVLERKTAKIIAEVGFYWTTPAEKFFYETTTELEPGKKAANE